MPLRPAEGSKMKEGFVQNDSVEQVSKEIVWNPDSCRQERRKWKNENPWFSDQEPLTPMVDTEVRNQGERFGLLDPGAANDKRKNDEEENSPTYVLCWILFVTGGSRSFLFGRGRSVMYQG